MAEWCTKQSFCPFDGVIKPNPFASLNHFTVPVVRAISYSSGGCRRSPVMPYLPTVLGSRSEPPRCATTHRDLAVSQVPGDVTGPRATNTRNLDGAQCRIGPSLCQS